MTGHSHGYSWVRVWVMVSVPVHNPDLWPIPVAWKHSTTCLILPVWHNFQIRQRHVSTWSNYLQLFASSIPSALMPGSNDPTQVCSYYFSIYFIDYFFLQVFCTHTLHLAHINHLQVSFLSFLSFILFVMTYQHYWLHDHDHNSLPLGQTAIHASTTTTPQPQQRWQWTGMAAMATWRSASCHDDNNDGDHVRHDEMWMANATMTARPHQPNEDHDNNGWMQMANAMASQWRWRRLTRTTMTTAGENNDDDDNDDDVTWMANAMASQRQRCTIHDTAAMHDMTTATWRRWRVPQRHNDNDDGAQHMARWWWWCDTDGEHHSVTTMTAHGTPHNDDTRPDDTRCAPWRRHDARPGNTQCTTVAHGTTTTTAWCSRMTIQCSIHSTFKNLQSLQAFPHVSWQNIVKKKEERDTPLFIILFNKQNKYYTALFLSFLSEDMIWGHFLCWDYKKINLFVLPVPWTTKEEKTM